MADEVILVETTNEICILTLNRPQVHNAVDEAVMERLENVLDRIEGDASIRAIVLTGAGDRTFSAGGDLKYFGTLQGREAGLGMSRRMQGSLRRLYEGTRPVVAAVNGRALGGGCEILTACHLRVAANTSVFSFRQAANGLITGWGGGTRLFQQMPRAWALDLLLTSRGFDAQKALEMGFVNRVVPEDRVLEEARALANQVAGYSATSVESFLELARAVDGGDAEFAVNLETERFGDCWESETFGKTLDSFGRKR